MYKNYKDPIARSLYLKKYQKTWKQLNKKKIRDYNLLYMKKYRILNKEKVAKSRKKYYEVYKKTEKYSLSRKKYRKTLNFKYFKYKYSAKARGYKFSLTKEDFALLLSNQCHYCGSKESIGIDRKDNQIGYELTNCLSCCSECNFFKGSRDYESFIKKCISISSFVVNS